MTLVLSLFPGIGLLDMAFELEGFCVVRGPDLLWGGDIKRFHPPAGRFDGIIGGPPCQRFSRLANIVRAVHGEDSVAEDLIPEFERVIREAKPWWFLMENVPAAPLPETRMPISALALNNRWFGGVQNRQRRFVFGHENTPARSAWILALVAEQSVLEPADKEPAVCGSAGGRRASVSVGGSGKRKKQSSLLTHRTLEHECELQGLPPDYFGHSPLTADGKRKALGNGVPLHMGRAVARAVRAAIEAAS